MAQIYAIDLCISIENVSGCAIDLCECELRM